MCLSAQNLTYIHPDREILFENISFSIQKNNKTALVGNNGSGKSTLLKILAGVLSPSSGNVYLKHKPYFIPQHFGQYNDMTVAEALNIQAKLMALNNILSGNSVIEDFSVLDDDWIIEERSREAISNWQLKIADFSQKLANLSGGEKTKLFLAGIFIHNPEIILLDEPTNHLDESGRKILYDFVENCTNTLVVVSHDRCLLELLEPVYELDKAGIKVYGGNYLLYKEQKESEKRAVVHQLEDKHKELLKAKKTEMEALERKQRNDARGKKKHIKERTLPALMNKLRNKAEESSGKLKKVHIEKIENINRELQEVKQGLPKYNKMKMDFEDSALYKGKILIDAEEVNFRYENKTQLWKNNITFNIVSGERICIKGDNGSGKTTLIKMILGTLKPSRGILTRSEFNAVYIDQDYSLIRNELTVYQQAQSYNFKALQEHEIKIRLYRYLFNKDYWDKLCSTISGGEKMRLMLCCLMIGEQMPDMFILDEPTNNLDIENIEILTEAVKEYNGTLLVVSHDKYFLEEININKEILIE